MLVFMNHYKILVYFSKTCNFICNIRSSICQGFALGERWDFVRTFIKSIYPRGAIFVHSDGLSHPPRELATAKAMVRFSVEYILSESAWRRFDNENATPRNSRTHFWHREKLRIVCDTSKQWWCSHQNLWSRGRVLKEGILGAFLCRLSKHYLVSWQHIAWGWGVAERVFFWFVWEFENCVITICSYASNLGTGERGKQRVSCESTCVHAC